MADAILAGEHGTREDVYRALAERGNSGTMGLPAMSTNWEEVIFKAKLYEATGQRADLRHLKVYHRDRNEDNYWYCVEPTGGGWCRTMVQGRQHQPADDMLPEMTKILLQREEEKVAANKNKTTRKKPMKVGLYKYQNGHLDSKRAGKVCVDTKVGRDQVTLAVFDTVKEAREALLAEANFEAWEQALDKWRAVPSHRAKINRPRTGPARRQVDITPELFTETFGPRGVQWGNSMTQPDRQASLNAAWDALMDMAETIDVPPKALFLEGTLGIAFGARGRGGTNAPCAHYEPGQRVINLTKRAGAGSLAHEWFHALDHHLAGAHGGGTYLTESGHHRDVPDATDEERRMARVLTDLCEETGLLARARNLDRRRSGKKYWSEKIELAARSFEAALRDAMGKEGLINDYLVNINEEPAWELTGLPWQDDETNDYPYPKKADRPAFWKVLTPIIRHKLPRIPAHEPVPAYPAIGEPDEIEIAPDRPAP